MQLKRKVIIVASVACCIGICIFAFLVHGGTNGAGREQAAGGTAHLSTGNTNGEVATSESTPDTARTGTGANDDLAALEEILDVDPVDLMDMEWNQRAVVCDFSSREKVAEAVRSFALVTDARVAEEQLDLLRETVTESVYRNGSNDYVGYLDHARRSGERVAPSIDEFFRRALTERSAVPKQDVPTDPWELVSKVVRERDYRSRWKGLVVEGSEIKIFPAETPNVPHPGEELSTIRGSVRTYHDWTDPPLSLEEAIRLNGTVLIADVKVFVAHEDAMGGIVRPYVIRYWLDPVHDLWRAKVVSAYPNRHERFEGYMMP